MSDVGYDGIAERIQSVYASCSKSEQDILIQILREMAISGESATLEKMWLSDFKEVPVSIDEFICNPLYLGEANRNGNAVYPFWKSTCNNIFDAGNQYNEIILSGATRIGKSSTAIIIASYMLYRLMLYRNPHEYFQKKEVSRFSVIFANLTKDLAYGVGYREFQDTLRASEWFNNHGSFSRSDRNFYYIPEGNNIEIIGVSDAAQALGKQVWCISGETKILTENGLQEIEALEGQIIGVYQYSPEGDAVLGQAKIIKTKEVTEMIELELEDGSVFRGTPEHLIMLSDGSYKALGELTEDDDIASPEIWLNVDETHQVSDRGRVKRLGYGKTYTCKGGQVRTTHFVEREMDGHINLDGYRQVDIESRRGSKSSLVHRIVAEYFLPSVTDTSLVINHKDGVKTNNCISNLEWCTTQEDIHHFWTAECHSSHRKEQREKQSIVQKGKKRSFTDEHLKNLRDALAKNKKDPEFRRKISEGLKGRHYSKETRKKIGDNTRRCQKCRISVTNGVESKRIFPEELDIYIQNGWRRGNGRKKFKWYNNGQVEKLVIESNVSSLSSDFTPGRLRKTVRQNREEDYS